MSALTKRIFEIGPETSDLWVRIEVDTEKMTPSLASEVNAFWVTAASVLQVADGDPVRAVALRAAAFFLGELIEHGNPLRHNLSDVEGWPRDHGISLLDFDVPDLDALSLEITAETAR